ncbi:hypothetical protein ACQJBY_060083 [Aegilops geniculata]
MDSSHAAGARHRSPPSTGCPESGREPEGAEPSHPDLRVAQRHNHHHRRSGRDQQPHDLYFPTPAYPPPQPVRRPVHSAAGSKSLDAATTQTPPGGAQPPQQSGGSPRPPQAVQLTRPRFWNHLPGRPPPLPPPVAASYHIEKFDLDNRFSSMSLHSAAFLCSFLVLTKDVVFVDLCT